MLVAETHGKVLEDALNNEDYLTAAVFGHLRYVPPATFWQSFFERSKSSTAEELPLTAILPHSVSDYTRLQVLFWPYSPQYGEPDVVLRFSGGNHPALIVIVEVKLWAGKSGFDEQDQLARYLRLLNDLRTIDVAVGDDDVRVLLYLTPRYSLTEIEESLATLPDGEAFRQQIFRIQWQDLLRTAQQELPASEGTAALILTDIVECLHRRDLEYFDGFRSTDSLDIAADDGHFYAADRSHRAGFSGFECIESLVAFEIQKGGWIA